MIIDIIVQYDTDANEIIDPTQGKPITNYDGLEKYQLDSFKLVDSSCKYKGASGGEGAYLIKGSVSDFEAGNKEASTRIRDVLSKEEHAKGRSVDGHPVKGGFTFGHLPKVAGPQLAVDLIAAGLSAADIIMLRKEGLI